MTSDRSKQYHYGTGKRKTAIAGVKLFEGGSGQVTVNGGAIREYFTAVQAENALAPLKTTGNAKLFDVIALVRGGGKAGQSDAIRHGLSRALLLISPELRVDLKRAGFLRRDARIKERKKPGLKRARRAPQFAKR